MPAHPSNASGNGVAQPAAEDPGALRAFETELGRLVETFDRNLADYKSSRYDEASLRQEFLNPLFRALGWDVENLAGRIPQHREVEIESRTDIGGRQKRADYLFRTDRTDRLVCEAKKPAEELNARAAFQAKRYAWNKGLSVAVLSDFEELHLYVVGSKPHPGEAAAGLWKSWHYRQYASAAREIWDLLARANVAAGALEKAVDALPRRPTGKGRARQQWLLKPDRSRSLDADFLNFLDAARRDLASDLIRRNDRADLLEDNRLNEAVQRILDRLLFLRICEDRDIDTGKPLAQILRSWRDHAENPVPRKARQPDLELRETTAAYETRAGRPPRHATLWGDVVEHFQQLDRRPPSHVPFFNGNLFKPHFSEELQVGDEWLAGFLDEIGDEESPYLFNVIPVEILGTIYERFLGKVVRPHGRGVTIEEKPEVRKAGGVYYTPRYIVDYIVEQTVGRLLAENAPAKSLELRVLDPACGSGSFLIRAFERLCEHWQTAFKADPRKQRRKDCWTDPATGDLHLTTDFKRRLLTANIYGVDLDPGAVEVTQLSLYLKMLEGENRQTLAAERDLFGSDIALLPPLEHNIKCGNSLIASDFSLVPEDLVRVKAFDWDVQFATIMKDGGFDAVIGNPPYVLIEDGQEKGYLQTTYRCDEGKPDLFKYFIEQSHRLLCNAGRFGMIFPSSFLKTPAYRKCRTLVLDASAPETVVLFRGSVFGDAQVNCIILITRHPAEDGTARWIEDQEPAPSNTSLVAAASGCATVPLQSWRQAEDKVFSGPASILAPWVERMARRSVTLGSLGKYSLGMQVYHNTIHSRTEMEQRISHSPKPRKGSWLRESRGTNVQRYFFISEMAEWVEYGSRCYYRPDREFSNGPRLNKAVIVFRSDEVDLKYVLGLLNSRLVGRYVSETTEKGTQRLFPRISLRSFRNLPMPVIDLSRSPDRARHDKMVSLVDKMLALVPKLRAAKSEQERKTLQNAVDATDRQIDELVYELYGLTKDEIALVERESK
jgi:hypothetical protein